MIYLLDTNTCIRWLNGTSEAVRNRVDETPAGDIVLCSVVQAELWYGAKKSGRPAKNSARLVEFFAAFDSLPFDDAAARAYGGVRSILEKSGWPIGPNDLMIAAIALANEVVLVTNNVREFERVDGLAIEDWESS